MGGDNGPSITVPAAIQACEEFSNLHIKLCGREGQIRPYLENVKPYVRRQLDIVHCEEFVANDTKPSSVIRDKSDTSMRKALELILENQASACVSAGNTGALFALSYYLLKPLEGVKRPALISALPRGQKKKVFLLDLGANVESDANTLFQYAVMGSVLVQQVEGINRPKVALLNVGVEQNKGNGVVKAAHDLLTDIPDINYVGYVEGGELFHSEVDVIVADGFVGNVVLKASEGLAKFLMREAKRVAKKNWGTKFLAWFALPLLKRVYNKVNPDQYNGASLIGLRGIVVKSHGNASKDAFYYAILEAMKEVERRVPQQIESKINQVLAEKAKECIPK